MNRVSRFILEIPDAHLDCALYALLAYFIFAQSYYGGDEAAKYMSPMFKFHLNGFLGGAGAVCGAIKMFRSTGFAKHKEEKQKEADTQVFQRASEPGPVP